MQPPRQYIPHLLDAMEHVLYQGGLAPFYEALKAVSYRLRGRKLKSFYDWHFHHSQPEWNEYGVNWCWPLEPALPYRLAYPKQGEGFLPLQADLAGKRQLILRYVANQMTSFDSHQLYHPSGYNRPSLAKITHGKQANGTLIVTQTNSRSRQWTQLLNRFSSSSGRSGYLQGALDGLNDHNQTDCVALRIDRGKQTLRNIWHDPVLDTGLYPYLTKAAANPEDGRRALFAAQGEYNHYLRMANNTVKSIHDCMNLIKTCRQATEKLQSPYSSANEKTRAYLTHGDLLQPMAQAWQLIKYRLDSPPDLPGNPETLYALDEDELDDYGKKLSVRYAHLQLGEELRLRLALNEGLIRMYADRFLRYLTNWYTSICATDPLLSGSQKNWKHAFLCFPVICVTVGELPALLKTLPISQLQLTILDQQHGAFTPESILSMIGRSETTILLRGD